MIDLKPLTSEFVPISALIAYENGHESYLEVHEIKDGKIGAGKPLSIESAKKIKGLFEDIDDKIYQSLSGAVPKNLLFANTDKNEPVLIWHSKPMKVKMHFAKHTKIKGGYAWVPALLWVFNNGSISIYAIKSTSLKSKVFNAPFFNVYDDGGICMGNVSIQKEFNDFEQVINTIQNYFFNSEFTLEGNNDKRIKISMIDFWSSQTNKQLVDWNYNEWSSNHLLMPHKQFKTIADVIEKYTR